MSQKLGPNLLQRPFFYNTTSAHQVPSTPKIDFYNRMWKGISQTFSLRQFVIGLGISAGLYYLFKSSTRPSNKKLSQSDYQQVSENFAQIAVTRIEERLLKTSSKDASKLKNFLAERLLDAIERNPTTIASYGYRLSLFHTELRALVHPQDYFLNDVMCCTITASSASLTRLFNKQEGAFVFIDIIRKNE